MKLKQNLRNIKPRVTTRQRTNVIETTSEQKKNKDIEKELNNERELNKKIKGNHILNSIKLIKQEEKKLQYKD